jgi:hypothetical protein
LTELWVVESFFLFYFIFLGDKYGVPFEAFHPGLAGACGSGGVAVEMMRVVWLD